MLFLYSIAILTWISLFQIIGTVTGKYKTSKNEKLITIATLMAATMLVLYAFFSEVGRSFAFENGGTIEASESGWPALWMFGTGSILAIGIYGYRSYRLSKKTEASFWTIGANIFGLITGLYIAFVVIDQIRFHAGGETGFVTWDHSFETSYGVNDIDCNSPILLIKSEKNEAMQFRCPTQNAMILGKYTSTPIVPWPSYSEGQSKQLAAAIKKLIDSAQKTRQ